MLGENDHSDTKVLDLHEKEIIPVLEAKINKGLNQSQYQESDLSVEWWFNDMMTKKSVWEPIEKWLHDIYSPSTEKVKG